MNNRLKQHNTEQGFTLIELLVVIIIIGILAAIAIPIFMNQQKAAIDSGIKSDVNTARIAITAWQANHPQETSFSSHVEEVQNMQGQNFTGENAVTVYGYPSNYCIKGMNKASTEFPSPDQYFIFISNTGRSGPSDDLGRVYDLDCGADRGDPGWVSFRMTKNWGHS